MRVLWIATKPPVPPADGGRLLAWGSLRGLAERGHELVLVAPSFDADTRAAVADELAVVCRPELVPARLPSRARAVLRSLTSGAPITIARHTQTKVEERVRRLLAAERFDLVHAEQLQAMPAARPALAAGLPVVLRAQNVESDLWRQAGSARRDPWLALEGYRLERWERRASRHATRVAALSEADLDRLGDLSGDPQRIDLVPAPFPSRLEPGSGTLEGDPALVLLAGRGWWPNTQGARWFLREVWQRVAAEVPSAVLHWFGGEPHEARERLRVHPAPESSAAAFVRGAILLVPLQVASGVRMKILEAWARGLPTVATPAAAGGLGATAGRELLIGASAADFASAVVRLARDPDLGRGLVAAGRLLLASRHDPSHCAELLERCHARAVSDGVSGASRSG